MCVCRGPYDNPALGCFYLWPTNIIFKLPIPGRCVDVEEFKNSLPFEQTVNTKAGNRHGYITY